MKVCVARAHHSGDLLPGKALLRHKACHVSYDGKEHSIGHFEVLLNSPSFAWVSCKDGKVPANAVAGGKTSSGEILYIGNFFQFNLKSQILEFLIISQEELFIRVC